MPAQQLCLTDDTLRSLMLGTYDGHDAETVSDHLLACPTCGQKAEQLAKSDPLLADLHALGDTSELGPDGTFVEELVQRVRKVALGNRPTQAELAFLAPPLPGYPTDLGTLDRYRILELLGQGGMGMVFQAADPMLKRTVALKVILPKYASDTKLRERFLEEARATVAVRSPYVAEVYDCGVWKDVPFLTMELLSGMTLDKKPKPMPPEAWVPIATDIALGLSDAHRHGVIHRDLKPSNIHLGADPRTGRPTLKIIDFGLARPVERDAELTKAGEVLGTPAYMSPEQALGHAAVDGRTDLYSLGVILHQLATGKLPYLSVRDGAGANAVLAELVTPVPLPSVRNLAPTLSPALVALIDRLLAKDRADRFASADAVADALLHFTSDDKTLLKNELVETAAFTPPHAEPSAKPRHRWPAVVVGLAVVLAGVAVAMNGLPWIKNERVPEIDKTPTPKPIVTIGTHDRRHRGDVIHLDTASGRGFALLLGRTDGVKLWNTNTLKLKATAPPKLFGEFYPWYVAVLNADWFVAAHGIKLYVLKLNGETMDLHYTYDYEGEAGIEQFKASPDGKWLAVCRAKQVDFFTLEQLQQRKTATTTVPDVDLRPSGADLPPLFSRFTNDSKSLGLITRAGVQFLTLADNRWAKGELIPINEKDVIASFAVEPNSGAVFVSSAKRDVKDMYHADLTTTAIHKWERRDGGLMNAGSVTLDHNYQPGRIELTPMGGLVLTDSVSQFTRFTYDGPLKIQAQDTGIATGVAAPTRVIADHELLMCDGSLLRKFTLRGREWKEVDPRPNYNVGLYERSKFARFGNFVMTVGREAGAPVRVWSLAPDGARQLFEQKATSTDQFAALSPNGHEVLIEDGENPPVVWGFDDMKNRKAITTFGESAKRHEPLGLTADGKYALMLQRDGENFTVWRRDKLAAPVAKQNASAAPGEEYVNHRVFTVKGGWRIMLIGHVKAEQIIDPIDVRIDGDAVTFTKGKRFHGTHNFAVRENFTLTFRQPALTASSRQWTLEDRAANPPVETTVPVPADFRQEASTGGCAVSPSGNVLALYHHSGHAILFDRTTMKTLWDYQFPGGIEVVDFADDETHLMVIHADGVLEIVDTKAEAKK